MVSIRQTTQGELIPLIPEGKKILYRLPSTREVELQAHQNLKNIKQLSESKKKKGNIIQISRKYRGSDIFSASPART